MFLDLVKSNRSYRRFDNSVKMTDEQLRSCVEAARLSSSGGNAQTLRFCIVNDENTANKVFEALKFAAYLKDWKGPKPGERPCAYIVLMLDSELTAIKGIDMGIAAESILLRATEMGFGGCMFRSFNNDALSELLNKDPYHPELVIALGKPSETVKLVECSGDIKYYRDENDNHCVPKRSLDDLII